MGLITTLYEVDGVIFDSAVRRGLVCQLIDVIKGYEPLRTFSLPHNYTFKNCCLDQAWYHFYPLLMGMGKHSMANEFRSDAGSHVTDYKEHRVYYWYSIYILYCLTSVWNTVHKLNRDIRKYTIGNADIILPDELDKAFEVLWSCISQRLSNEKKWLDYYDTPFDWNNIDYVFQFLCSTICFMTESVYQKPKDSSVIVRISEWK